MFSQVSVCQHGGSPSRGGLCPAGGGGGSHSEGLLPGSLCQGRSPSGEVSVQGFLSRGVSVWGFLYRGILCPGGLCPGGSLSGRSPCTVTCGRYSSYLDAFFLQCILSLSYMAFQIEPTKIYWIRYFNFITNK